MNKKTTIAALGDIHMNANQHGKWKTKFEEISEKAKVLLLCGDLTDTGDEEEAELLVAELQSIKVPVVAVLGNHDYEKGRQKQIRQILTDSKITVLDGEAIVIENIGFAGIKGFGGGFDRYLLSMFGEDAMKSFVQEAVNESLLLDRALARLEQEHAAIKKVALLHYAPIAETVLGEPEQIYPFLGSTHLMEPLQRRKVTAAFHGHAHAGKFKALSPAGIPIYNVAVPVLKAHHGDDTCFALIDI
ncbi:metallophosphoesterase [Sphingobacterium sp. BIGb0116]|uniref:metallophosphoesterase family protein n=1 Tax=Sphingobacterium sp. BIGb0116 TaxID=2940619 RepID=UPI0021691DC4|nr:metallophosphoesterase [Sphingobacterium sp. BIGb0116]MCS4165030.1 Icc-related predicted phosphoesterase [Sphingobacterium sp. BIGb0116]